MRPHPTPCRLAANVVAAAFAFAGMTSALAAPVPTVSDEAWMSEKELGETFGGLSIAGRYFDGRHFEEQYAADGSILYEEGPITATGRWSVTAGTFCTIYDGDPSGGCFRVSRVGENCFEFYFVARTEAEAEASRSGRPAWTAQAWRTDTPSTCRDESIV